MKQRLYRYRAVDSYGEPLDGTMEAESAERVTSLLNERGVQVNKVEPLIPDQPLTPTGRPLDWQELSMFNEQLMAITKSKLPLAPSIKAMSRDLKKGALKFALDELQKELELGRSLEEAIASHPHLFPAMYISMIRAGERTGNLPGILEMMNTHSTRMVDLKNQLRLVLAYPAMVLSLSILIIGFILIKVVPVFADIFAEFGAGLPAPTQFLVDLSDFITQQFSLFLILLPFINVGIIALWYYLRRTTAGQHMYDLMLSKTPILGRAYRLTSLARFARSLGLMLKSQVPILESLDLAAASSGNSVLTAHINRVAIQVARGERMADAFSDTNYFPHAFCWFLANGEAYGNIPEVLLDASHAYEQDVARNEHALISILGPALVTGLGITIGFIIVALYMPIFSLGDAMQGL